MELSKEVTLLKSQDMNLRHTIAQVVSEPLGALCVTYCWASQPRDAMHVGRCPRPVHHLGGWWEACPQELGEDHCQRAGIFWPINNTRDKKYKRGVKVLAACGDTGEESWRALRALKAGQEPEQRTGCGDTPGRGENSRLDEEQ